METLTILGEHSHHLQADVLLHGELKVSQTGNHARQHLHDVPDVVPQLVCGDGPAHHGGEAGLQGHQICGHLQKKGLLIMSPMKYRLADLIFIS